MIIEVKTVEILTNPKLQIEATKAVKENQLISYIDAFKHNLRESRNDGYVKEIDLYLGIDENSNLIPREYAKVILSTQHIHSNKMVDIIIQEIKKTEKKIKKERQKIEKVFW